MVNSPKRRHFALALAIALALMLIPCVLGASSSTGRPDSSDVAAPADTIDLRQPTLVAYFVAPRQEADSDTFESISEAAGDFQFYLSAILDSLSRHGVRLLVVEDSSAVIRDLDGQSRTIRLIEPHGVPVGYWLFRPGGLPRHLTGGVRTDTDLIEQAAKYFPGWLRND
jgi:hypothetical protein